MAGKKNEKKPVPPGKRECPKCHGTGDPFHFLGISAGYFTCRKCDGKGWVNR